MLLGAVLRRAASAAPAAHSTAAPPSARARSCAPSLLLLYLQAILKQGRIFKEIIEAMKDLVTDANLECGEDGLKLQAMDSSHVSLISLAMTKEGFDEFRCDRSLFLGLNLVRVCAHVQQRRLARQGQARWLPAAAAACARRPARARAARAAPVHVARAHARRTPACADKLEQDPEVRRHERRDHAARRG